MNPSNASQPDESRKDADCYCRPHAIARTISPEQLRLWLNDRRNTAQEVRRGLLRDAARLKDEIAIVDALLAELTIG